MKNIFRIGLFILLVAGFVGCGGGKYMQVDTNAQDYVRIRRSVRANTDPQIILMADKIELQDRILIIKGNICVLNIYVEGVAFVAGNEIQIRIPDDAPYKVYIYRKNGNEEKYELRPQ